MNEKYKGAIKDKIKKSDYRNHETKKHLLKRFILVVLIVLLYSVFMSFKYGIEQGLLVTILTWTFFVFCTPIADAGFLLALPIRMLTGIRMMYTPLFSFVLAFGLNLYPYFYTPSLYESTVILRLFYHILSQPFPFWGILLLSLFGPIL